MLEINKSYHGDCLDLMPLIPDKSINLILCDLPYGTTYCKWDAVIPFNQLWNEYERIITDTGVIVLTASMPFTAALVLSNPKLFKYEMIWCKTKATDFLNAKGRPMKKHESIVVFSKGQSHSTATADKKMCYNPQGLKPFNKIKNGDKRGAADAAGHRYGRKSYKTYVQEFTNYPNSILNFPSEGKTIHPTQKSVSLFEYLCLTYSNPGDTVLDNAAGVATTAIACINTNRNYIIMEKDEGYYNKGLKRIAEHEQHLSNNAQLNTI